MVIPIAIEYCFWGERTPEALIHVGKPIETIGREHTAARWNAMLSARLQRTMDELAELAMTRDPARFQTLVGGAGGSNPIYDAWCRIFALAQGKSFSADHLPTAPETVLACHQIEE